MTGAGVGCVDIVDEFVFCPADAEAEGIRDAAHAVTTRPDAAALSAFDVVIKSPGISAYRPEIIEAQHNGTQFTSGTALWFAEHPGDVVGERYRGQERRPTGKSRAHRHPGDVRDGEADRDERDRRAEVRLSRNEDERNGGERARDGEVLPRDGSAPAVAEKLREHERDRRLRKLGRLQVDDAEVDPAARAAADDAEDQSLAADGPGQLADHVAPGSPLDRAPLREGVVVHREAVVVLGHWHHVAGTRRLEQGRPAPGVELLGEPDPFEQLMRDTGAPARLSELGYGESDIPALAEGALKQQRLLVCSPREVDATDLEAILRASL